ncbi:heat-inducible transcriptional repressor HrcA [Ligilactobacillus equi]|uniref:heat-inducible transcriptional repressor HrcA n=1 Tax=Ligilactobacillus equi TaxID=137357 RepID=UPI002ED4D8A4
MLTERQLLILEAIIRDYTNIGQPIGSKVLQQQLPIHVSSATIRNEMLALEKMGYLKKEHSSSGRIPSLKGYRYYIDNLVEPMKLDKKVRTDIRRAFGNELLKVDDLVQTSAKLLSDLTNYTAITLKPETATLRLEGFRLVPLGRQQVMAIMVTSDGSVQSQIFTIPAQLSGEELEPVIRAINDRVIGLPLSQVPAQLQALTPFLTKYLQDPGNFLDVFGNILSKAVEDQVFVDGKLNLLDFTKSNDVQQIKALYSLLEERPLLGKLTATDANQDVSVRFGDDFAKSLSDYSIVSATYGDPHAGQGIIAILGPTNMPYSKMIGILGAFQQELTARLLNYYKNFEE